MVGRGRMGGTKPGSGPGGTCVCPKCGTRVPHAVSDPCYNKICLKCGARMVSDIILGGGSFSELRLREKRK